MSSGGMSGSTETLLVGIIIGGLMTAGALLGGGCQGDPSPKDEANHDCEVAWVDANDGDPETKPAPVIDQPWCQAHNTTMTTTTIPEAP
jgi:hypothetical protein